MGIRVVVLLLCMYSVSCVAKHSAIVIGTGMSGMGAATTLHGAGFDVTVLEARNRLGGRSYTTEVNGLTLDIGASWIHGWDNNPVRELALKFNAAVKKTDYENLINHDSSGAILPSSYNTELIDEYDKLIKEVDHLRNNLDGDMSLGDAIEKVYKEKKYSESEQYRMQYKTEDEITLDYAGKLKNLSLQWYDCDDVEKGGDYILYEDGYKTIIDGLAAELPEKSIHLNNEVTSIDTSKDGSVTVKTVNPLSGAVQEYTADFLIVTVPLGVLKHGAIHFHPSLPHRLQQSIDRLQMGNLNKAILSFPEGTERMWNQNNTDIEYFYYIANSSDYGLFAENLNIWHFNHHKTVIESFIVEDFSEFIENLPDAERVALQMRTFRLMFPDLPDPIGHHYTTWRHDKYAYGSYSYVAFGATPKDMDEFLKPFGRMFFAGEHTTRHAFGQTKGAWQTGLSAAAAVQKAATMRQPMELEQIAAWEDEIFALRDAIHTADRHGAPHVRRTWANGLFMKRRWRGARWG